MSCDLLAVSNGWSPTVHLTCHLGGKPVWDDALHAFVPGRLPPGLSVVGAAAGRLTLAEALATGGELGRQAAADCGFARPHKPLIPAQAGTQSCASRNSCIMCPQLSAPLIQAIAP